MWSLVKNLTQKHVRIYNRNDVISFCESKFETFSGKSQSTNTNYQRKSQCINTTINFQGKCQSKNTNTNLQRKTKVQIKIQIQIFREKQIKIQISRGKAKVQIQQHWPCLGRGWGILFVCLLAGCD